MPETLLGLVLFAASVGPGYLFLRIAERWEPQRKLSSLQEAAELVVIGAIASVLAALIVLLVGEAIGGIDSEQLVADRFTYVIREPGTSLLALVAFLIVSYGSTAVIAYLRYTPFDVKREHRREIHPADDPWFKAFSRDAPSDHTAAVTLGMRDGRRIDGILSAFSMEDSGRRGIVLAPPIGGHITVAESVEAERKSLKSDRLVLDEDDVREIFVRYFPLDAPGSADGGE